MAVKTYDPACETLAEHFLQDGNPNDHYRRDSLAVAIQQAVEDWFEDHAPIISVKDVREAIAHSDNRKNGAL